MELEGLPTPFPKSKYFFVDIACVGTIQNLILLHKVIRIRAVFFYTAVSTTHYLANSSHKS